MATFNDVFERKEVKYVLNEEQYQQMIQLISSRMGQDSYGETTITSIYYDTPYRDLISKSLEKPLYKEKLRVRHYGDFGKDDCVFIELKKKFKGIVYKRRIGVSRKAAQLFLDGVPYETAIKTYPFVAHDPAEEEKIFKLNTDAHSYRSKQIANEISSFMDRYEHLTPSMAIICERAAWAPLPENLLEEPGEGMSSEGVIEGVPSLGGVQNMSAALNPNSAEGVRITFDRNIRFYDYRSQSLHGSYSGKAILEPCPLQQQYIMKPGDTVMEIKVGGSFPLWLVKALSICDAKPSSFSKYGSAYKHATYAQREPLTFIQKIAQRAVLSETQSKKSSVLSA